MSSRCPSKAHPPTRLLPSLQLGGNHRALFDGYWVMLDPQASGKIDAAHAAGFLKKSQLREPVLHKVSKRWVAGAACWCMTQDYSDSFILGSVPKGESPTLPFHLV